MSDHWRPTCCAAVGGPRERERERGRDCQRNGDVLAEADECVVNAWRMNAWLKLTRCPRVISIMDERFLNVVIIG